MSLALREVQYRKAVDSRWPHPIQHNLHSTVRSPNIFHISLDGRLEARAGSTIVVHLLSSSTPKRTIEQTAKDIASDAAKAKMKELVGTALGWIVRGVTGF